MIALLANWKRILYGTALALLGALLLVQTVRIEGFLFWDGLKAENTELRETLAKVEASQKLATEHAKAEKARIEALNERKANEARELEKKLRSDYSERVARFMRSQAGRPAGSANLSGPSEAASGTVGESGPAELPEGYALVPVRDLELSAQAFAKLESLQIWAQSVSE